LEEDGFDPEPDEPEPDEPEPDEPEPDEPEPDEPEPDEPELVEEPDPDDVPLEVDDGTDGAAAAAFCAARRLAAARRRAAARRYLTTAARRAARRAAAAFWTEAGEAVPAGVTAGGAGAELLSCDLAREMATTIRATSTMPTSSHRGRGRLAGVCCSGGTAMTEARGRGAGGVPGFGRGGALGTDIDTVVVRVVGASGGSSHASAALAAAGVAGAPSEPPQGPATTVAGDSSGAGASSAFGFGDASTSAGSQSVLSPGSTGPRSGRLSMWLIAVVPSLTTG
jgi:hypothetical protein